MATKRAHPTPPKSPNHRDYIRAVSPEMSAEYDIPLMRGVETKSPGSPGKAKTGSEQKIRGAN